MYFRGKVSLHAFTIFSRALVKNIKTLDLLRYRAQIHHYNPPLSVYITPLSSKSFSFLTILSITTCVSVVDLVKLSSATNLVALEIVPPVIDRGTCVNDRLVRTWSESCEQEQAFPVLRILRLRNHLDLTRQSLQYINKFPVLALYDIGRCDFSSESPIRDLWAGWKCVMYHDVLGQMETTCVERRRAMQEKLGNGSFRTQTLISQHLTNATEVKWLPRDRLPEFLTGRQDTIKTTSTQEHISPPSQTFRYSSSPEQLQEITAYMEPWDSNLQKLVDRIGELRNDHDFRTVMHLENQAIMGNDLINSYPMVSFRLGSSQLEFNTQVEVTELAFIRISLDNVSTPADRNLALGDAQSDRDSQSIRWETKSDRHANPNTKPMKRKPPGIKSKKRRKLEDVLKSFS